MAKGSVTKELVTQKILETFDGAFVYGKEIRLPFTEEGEPIEIKVTLTCAKQLVGESGPGPSATLNFEDSTAPVRSTEPKTAQITKPTEEEKKNVETLLSNLGF